MNSSTLCVVALMGLFVLATATKEACYCTRIYDPVCANTGRTYSNKCQFECDKEQSKRDLRIVKSGRCIEDEGNEESNFYE